MKKILVTGGVGFIGTNLIRKLKDHKLSVFSLDNYSTGSKKNHINISYLILDESLQTH